MDTLTLKYLRLITVCYHGYTYLKPFEVRGSLPVLIVSYPRYTWEPDGHAVSSVLVGTTELCASDLPHGGFLMAQHVVRTAKKNFLSPVKN